MDFLKAMQVADKALLMFRRGQLAIKDSEKVRDVISRNQARKLEIEEELGPRKPNRNRYKKIEGL